MPSSARAAPCTASVVKPLIDLRDRYPVVASGSGSPLNLGAKVPAVISYMHTTPLFFSG
jgi:hypothetical protein